MSKLYQSHIPLSAASKALLGVGSAAAAILNPARGDMVAAMGEATAAGPVLENLRRRMESDVCGRRLLSDRPRITDETIDREWLDGLPEGTLGKEYSNFLDRLHTHPDARPAVKFIDDERHLYVMQRYRETHDFNHVVLQQPTNMIGEVTVKYFEAIQFGLPMCTTAAIFGAARLRPKHRQQLLDVNLPWVVEQAKRARLFMCVDWEKRFEQPLEDLQEELGVRPIGRL